ncbi:glycosyltransferase [Anoxynatronum sibiricum]|uniref:Glycosyltransferase n=1 Tax=Anoxynatronum sibiricum TaxID=210623 RepID=A0ABU9VSK7_9CLOT
MATILFLIPPFYSHFHPMLTLAEAFRQQDWKVVVGTSDAFAPQVKEAGLQFETVTISRNANTGIAAHTRQAETENERLEAFFQATREGPEATLLVQSRHRQADMLADPEGLIRQVNVLNRHHSPTLWVVDQLSYGATLAMKCLKLPFITFCPPHPFSIPSAEGLFGVPVRWPASFHPDPQQMAMVEATATEARTLFTERFQEMLNRHGSQETVTNAFAETSPLAVVYQYPLVGGQSVENRQSIHAGYCFKPQPLPLEWEKKLARWERGKGRPRILLSFGTFLSRREDVLRRCVRGIRQAFPQSHILLAAGDSLPLLVSLADDRTMVEAFLPQTALYSQVDLVIHHGGCNTFVESLYFGKPMVMLPFSSDQFHIAADAEAMGVAQVLVPNTFTSEDLTAALNHALAMETRQKVCHWQQELHQRGPAYACREVVKRCFGT